jgi:hypothetical protein
MLVKLQSALRAGGVACVGAMLLCNFAPSFAAESISYSYDALGRLVTSSRMGGINNGVVVGFSYDAAGNRISLQISGASTGARVAGATQAIVGQAVILSAQLPDDLTGSVAFYSGERFLGEAPIQDGVAALGTAFDTAGVNLVMIKFGQGDQAFLLTAPVQVAPLKP